MPWNMLPHQIRNDVLARVVETAYSNNESLAGYASVCRDWQAFFEQHTFRSLDVTPGDLDMFETSFQEPGRRSCLQRVGLVLALPQHPPIRLHNDRGTTEEETALLLMRRLWDGGPGASFYPPELSHQQRLDNMALVSGISSPLSLASWRPGHDTKSRATAWPSKSSQTQRAIGKGWRRRAQGADEDGRDERLPAVAPQRQRHLGHVCPAQDCSTLPPRRPRCHPPSDVRLAAPATGGVQEQSG
ncbi:hypothetical protein MAJ_08499, partial [Metarhizium majus ARSEF 297]